MVTKGLRGNPGYIPSWTLNCGDNPTLNEILDTLDNCVQVKMMVTVGSGDCNDYIGATSAKVQEALNYVNANGGGIVFLQGENFTWSSTVKVYSNSIVFGAGVKTQLNLVNGVDAPFYENGDLVNGNLNIVIANLAFNGNKNNQAGVGNIAHAVRLYNCTNCYIQNNWGDNIKTDFALLTGSKNIYVFRNRMTNLGRSGVTISSLGGLSSYIYIDENHIESTGSHGIFSGPGEYVQVHKNIVKGTVNGINFQNGDNASNLRRGNKVTDNNIISCSGDAILMNYNLAPKIRNNTLDNITQYGLNLSFSTGVQAVGNDITNVGLDGIYSASSGDRFDISNNYISDIGLNGINLSRNRHKVSGNTIRNVSKNLSGQRDAILVQSGDYFSIIGNIILDDQTLPTTRYSIQAITATNNNIIVGNEISNNGTQGLNYTGANNEIGHNI